MASAALNRLASRLAEVDEVLAARDAICPKKAGRPAQRRGAAVIRAGVVLLSALFEGYVEELFDAAVDQMYSSKPAADRNTLKNETSGKLNNPGPFKVNMMFFHLGIPWIMTEAKLCWRKFPNAAVVQMLQDLIGARNKIAHGSDFRVRKPKLEAWRDQVQLLAERMDEVVADRVEAVTGARPW